MNFTHIHEIFLQQGCFIVTGLMPKYLRKQDWTEFSWRHNVHNTKFRLKARLEHGFAIEYT